MSPQMLGGPDRGGGRTYQGRDREQDSQGGPPPETAQAARHPHRRTVLTAVDA
jgi:hypothetical protein